MSSKIARGDKVHIKVGDEKGSWGIVRDILHGEYHVAIGGAKIPDRVYLRDEISRPRVQDVPSTPTTRKPGQPTAQQIAIEIASREISYLGPDKWRVIAAQAIAPSEGGDSGAPFAIRVTVQGPEGEQSKFIMTLASTEDDQA